MEIGTLYGKIFKKKRMAVRNSPGQLVTFTITIVI